MLRFIARTLIFTLLASSAMAAQINLLTQVQNALPIANGGTGQTSLASVTVGNATSAVTATNLAGGSGGTVPYQSSAGTTALLANGTVGQVFTAGGTTVAPAWSSTIAPTAINGVTTDTTTNKPVTAASLAGATLPASVTTLTSSGGITSTAAANSFGATAFSGAITGNQNASFGTISGTNTYGFGLVNWVAKITETAGSSAYLAVNSSVYYNSLGGYYYG